VELARNPHYAKNEHLADRAQELDLEDDLAKDFSAEDANPRSELIPAASRPKGDDRGLPWPRTNRSWWSSRTFCK